MGKKQMFLIAFNHYGVEIIVIIDNENKFIQVKIVYYGPAMSGKTTSIKYLFSHFNRKNELESIENSVGRTLFFDFGVLVFNGEDWNLKFLIYTSTGQDFYASTRPATLNGVDGIIFVADSQIERLAHNIRSWNELVLLMGDYIKKIPIVISLNKSDLFLEKNIENYAFLKRIDYFSYENLSIVKTSALTGSGVLECFYKLISFLFPELQMINSK
ncbi:MAG: GTP-binding protein [Promethearchaeota archaeon]